MDSGVGGLAVLKRLVQQMPQSPVVFLGDTAWMPYGEKALDVVRNRVLDVRQWLDQRYSLAAFILACNTATVATFDDLQALNLPYPLLEPVSTTAHWVNQHVDPAKKIGIMATPGTVTGGRYLHFLTSDRQIEQVACTGLASIVEAGHCEGPELDAILLPYLKTLTSWGAEVIVLGCTHYSLIRDHIQAIVGPHIQLVDSAEVLAEDAIPIIQRLNLGTGSQDLLVTGNAAQFSQAIQSLPLHELQGKPIQTISIEEASPSVTPVPAGT
jgi:glutamate racemase